MLAETKSKIEAHIRKHRAHGGKAEGPKRGVDDAEEDLKDNPKPRDMASKIEHEAEEKTAKRGGRMKRAHGGMAHKKHAGKVEGHEAHHHAGRRHRASGGSCEASPFTSARSGTAPKGRKFERETEGGNH